MSYADEREYSPGQKRIVILRYLLQRRRITAEQAARVAGCSERQAYNILLDIEGVECLRKLGCEWWLRQEDDEDNLAYGR
jgi:Fic family protein